MKLRKKVRTLLYITIRYVNICAMGGFMEELIRDILELCESSLADNKGEKEKLIEHVILINSVLPAVFADNRNLTAALEYFNEIMSSYIEESETEYLFYEKAIKYFKYLLDNLDVIDETMFSDIDDAIEYVEDLFVSRTINTVQVVEHYHNIFESGILTDRNFYIVNFADRFDEEEKKRLLGCIPEV